MLIFCSILGSNATGEWDDYSFPAISFLKQRNFGIDDTDIANFKAIFPSWANRELSFSPYKTKNSGAQMAWYFPTYGIACIPAIQTLRVLDLNTTLAFILG